MSKINDTLTKYSSLLICLALTLTTVAVFYQVSGFSFVNYDDGSYVYKNPNIQAGITFETIKWAFTTGYFGNWNPLTWLSHMLDWQLFGNNAGGHHLTNLIIHIANTLLLFIVLKQMTSALLQSAFVAVLFALHPLHVEAVAWVSCRKDVLSTFFWLLTMWAYLRYVKRPNISRYLLVLLFFVMGIMSKPMLVTLPFVLLLLDYWPLDRIGHFQLRILYRLILEKIPFMALAAVFSIMAFFTQRSIGAIMPLAMVNPKFRLCNALISYVKYIEKMVWPSRLAAFYPHPGPNVSILYALISAGLLLIATVLVLRYAKKHRYLVTGWFWYLVTLIPVIGLVQVGSHAMADRYTYIPLTGLFIIIAWGLPELFGKWTSTSSVRQAHGPSLSRAVESRYKKITLTLSALLVILIMSICTCLQLRYWRDSLTLFQHALNVTENSHVAHSKIADALYEQQRFDEAVIEYKKYLQIIPDDPDVLHALSVVLGRQGKFDEAVEYLTKALQIKPDFATAHNSLGYILAAQGKFDEAGGHYKEALRLNPEDAGANYQLARILVRKGKTNQAVGHFKEALRLKPDWDEPANILAWYFAVNKETGIYNPDEAVRLAQHACQLTNYQKPDFLDTLAVAYAAKGDFGKAVETLEKALALCQSTQQESLKKELESRLTLFKAGKPYVEN